MGSGQTEENTVLLSSSLIYVPLDDNTFISRSRWTRYLSTFLPASTARNKTFLVDYLTIHHPIVLNIYSLSQFQVSIMSFLKLQRKKLGSIVSIGLYLCLLRFGKRCELHSRVSVTVRLSIDTRFLKYIRRQPHHCMADDCECGGQRPGVEGMAWGLLETCQDDE